MDREMKTIYVYLINEGVDVWRPVSAEHMGDAIYRIVSSNENPDGEDWEFQTGQVVRCECRTLSEGQSLVAVEALSDTI